MISKAKALNYEHDEGGLLPAFVLLGLWAAFVLVPDTQLLDLKRALGFAWAAVAALWLAARAWQGKPLARPSRPFAAACAGLALAYGIAWAASPYPQAASFRVEVLGLSLFAALLAASLPEAYEKRWPWVALGAALLVSLYALVQRLGFEPMSAYAMAGSRERAVGSFGNATFLAAFLCFSWPLALLLRGWRRAALALVFMAALLATQSRAGVLALLVQLTVLGLQAWREGLRPRFGMAAVVLLALLASATLLFPWASWARPTLRPQLWAESLHLIARRPAFGWGPGSFSLAIQDYHSALFSTALGTAQYAEHPHNWVLGVLHEAGALGLLAFAFLLAVVRPWPSADAHRSPAQRAVAFGLLGLLLQNLFDRNLDQAGLALCFFAGMGFLSRSSSAPTASPWPRWSSVALLVLALACGWLGARPVLAYQRSVGQSGPAAVGDLGSLRQVAQQRPQDAAVWDQLGSALAAQALFSEAADAFAHALGLQASPGRAINLGNCWMMLEKPQLAEVAYRQAASQAPANADAHFSLGYALFKQKRLKEAVASLDAALKLEPGHAAAAKLKEQILR